MTGAALLEDQLLEIGVEELAPRLRRRASPALAAAMRQETLALVDDVAFTADGDFRDILDAPYTFVNGPLAALYGLTPDANQLGESWQRFDLPVDSKRGGILGQSAFLSSFAHVSSTSPTLRGKFVREALMCMGMPPPPPDVVTKLPEGAEYKTMRERLEQHKSEPCVGCHTLMDPIGLGLENFDGIGVFRTIENGVVLDTSETIQGLGDFDGARAAELTPTLLTAVVERRIRAVILDVTGISDLDPAGAGQLARLIGALRLLGAEGIVTGISPRLAQTLGALGNDAGLLRTYRSLSDGLRASSARPSG